MFLKKHSQPEWTPADRQRERLLLDYFAAETNLEEKAKVAIVRKGVIDLYPDGPDKDRAIKDFEAAQHSLLCAIGTVDGLRNDMRSYIAAHEKDFEAKKQSKDAKDKPRTRIGAGWSGKNASGQGSFFDQYDDEDDIYGYYREHFGR